MALGTAQRRVRRRALARATLEQAAAEFEALGAALWAERTRAELARHRRSGTGAGGAHPTERRVAALASEGQSNKEIAAGLFVTPKTVETQLSRIYAESSVCTPAAPSHAG